MTRQSNMTDAAFADNMGAAIAKLYGALAASTGFLQLELEKYRYAGDEKSRRIAESIEGQIGLNNAALDLARSSVADHD